MVTDTIDLGHSLRWMEASRIEQAMLGDLQMNILDGHGRKSTRNLFLRFNDPIAGRAFLRALAPRITSAAAQLQQAAVFRQGGIKGPPVLGLLLSHAGYQALEIGGKAPVVADGGAFASGMASRAAALGDDPRNVEEAYRGEIHAMILIGADPDGDNQWGSLAAEHVETQVLTLMQNAASVVTTEIGRAIFRDNGAMPEPETGRKIEGIEHFGYVDGRSQPLMLDELIDRERDESDGISVWDPAFPLAQVLVPDPGSPADGTAFGSFFVFRKLEQNVKAFKEAEEELGDDLGIGELAGAMLVGRFEDGTPVTLQRDEGAHTPVMNNFDYAGDMDGLRCPFHAHIRKTNPRGDTVRLFGAPLADERSHIMARRGMTYGQRNKVVDPSDMPTGNVGLMFMAFQANLATQFEFTQQSWANSPQFASGFAGRPDPGRDPIIGQRLNDPLVPLRMRDAWGKRDAQEHLKTFEEHVTFRGGEYFFAPSISMLAALP